MQIEVWSDHNVDGREAVVARVKGTIEHALGGFSYRITRVDVHLSDANGKKGGEDDKHCMMELISKCRTPSWRGGEGSTMGHAISGPVRMIKRSIESALDRERGED